jgi:hypothetical protein
VLWRYGLRAGSAEPRPLLNAPRSDPYGRDSRIRLPPRVFDAEAVRRPRMEDLGRRQPFTRATFDPFPCRDVLLAAPPDRAPPEVDNIEAERTEHANVGGHGVVVEPALDHLAKSFCRDGGSCMRFRGPSLNQAARRKANTPPRAALSGRANPTGREPTRDLAASRRARDGHRFESPQLKSAQEPGSLQGWAA